MTTIRESLAFLMLVALASHAGADVRHPVPGADVLHQQDTGIVEEEEDEDEDEEPDCE